MLDVDLAQGCADDFRWGIRVTACAEIQESLVTGFDGFTFGKAGSTMKYRLYVFYMGFRR
jgi:hypothetical protein